ncbi:MAG: DUF1549 domain-containing protein [Planctomycetes bacterium]|nr:DUF1549 domain-containing protein [Planctomycetota bacterium]
MRLLTLTACLAFAAIAAVQPSAVIADTNGEVHWSFRATVNADVPTIRQGDLAGNAIDRFLLADLQRESLSVAPPATPHVLVRRLHFDLIGLPPSPAAIDEFLACHTQNEHVAVSQLIDQLLASTQFGERWGRHWLDLVRFAESNGGDRNVLFPHAWRYRNYVIDSLNSDKPYDQFVREQIAGDLLEAKSRERRDEQLVATGMLTLGPKLFMETDAEQFRMDRVDEQIDVVSRTILGLTISCARCHDHKFDPITAKDYYALAGIFRSTYLLYGEAAPAGNQYGHDRPLQPIGEDGEQLQGPAKAWKKQVADKTAERNKARSDRYRIVRQKAALENRLTMLNGSSSTTELKTQIAALAGEIEAWDEKVAALDEGLAELVGNPPQLPNYCMAVRNGDVENSRVNVAGNVKDLGERVSRGFPAAIAFEFKPEIADDVSGRRELADWLTHLQNPLTARVIANRVWQHLLGDGLVRTVDNFGVNGETPSHPLLLDHLSWRLVHEHRWSVKELIREIIMSAAYQRASATTTNKERATSIDPENRLLWRQNGRTLEVEPLRDAILFVSGQLNEQRPNGSPISTIGKPELNSTVRLNEESFAANTRTLYLPVARFHLPAMMKTFGFADPSLVSGERESRTTAAQQLFFLNNVWVREQSKLAAENLLRDNESEDVALVNELYRRLFGRLPDEDERNRALDFVRGDAVESASDGPKKDGWQSLCWALMATAEFRTIE